MYYIYGTKFHEDIALAQAFKFGLHLYAPLTEGPTRKNRGEPPRSPSIIRRPYFQTDSIANAIIFDRNEL